MSWYGREDCQHEWRYREGGWEEECVPAVCIKCGAFGCQCDAKDYYGDWSDMPSKDVFFGEAQRGDANINGQWINPYVKKAGE